MRPNCEFMILLFFFFLPEKQKGDNEFNQQELLTKKYKFTFTCKFMDNGQ